MFVIATLYYSTDLDLSVNNDVFNGCAETSIFLVRPISSHKLKSRYIKVKQITVNIHNRKLLQKRNTTRSLPTQEKATLFSLKKEHIIA